MFDVCEGQLDVVGDVCRENNHQLAKWGIQSHSMSRWFLILAEEVAESVGAYLQSQPNIPHEEYALLSELEGVGYRAQDLLEGRLADRINHATHVPNLDKELVQVAAVAVAAVENLRRERQ